MKKIFTIFGLLLLCSTMAFADEEKVIIAKDISNGDVSYTIDGSAVTLTVTPNDGYYLQSVEAIKAINVSAVATTRANGPAVGVYALTRTSESTDLSTTATYTFTLDENLCAYVTAQFAARTEITADKLTLSTTSFVYNGTSQVPSVQMSGLTSGTDYTVSYAQESSTNVGNYGLTVTGISRYKDSLSATWAITAATLSGISATAYSADYDGAAHSISVTIPDGAAIKYGTAEGTYDKDAAPSFTNVGEYTVYYQVTKANYNAVAGSAKVNINQKALTITAEAKTKVYGTEDPALTYSVEGLVEGESLTGSLARAEGETVGEYDITQGTLAASANYSVTFTGAKFTITAATQSGITATAYSGTYDGAAHSISVTIPDGAAIKYGTTEGTYDKDAAPSFTNAGEYTVYYQVTKANYNAVTGSAKVNINQKALTITAEAKTKVFGTDDPALTYTVEGLVEGESLTGSLARAEGETVGEYDITQGTLAASANYSVAFTGAKLTITAATQSGITATAYSGTYDGAAHSISVTIPDGAAIKYGTAEGTYDKDAAPSFTNVGEYTVYYQVTKANFNAVAGSAKVNINQKALTITAEAKTKVYGTEDPALTYTVEGLVEGESLTGSLARAEGEAVGEYDITQGTLAASANYSLTFTGAKFTITAATQSGITATAYSGTYDGAAHSISVTIPDGAAIKYGTTEGTYDKDAAPSFTNAGEYTVYYQVTKANYNAVTGSAKVNINQKALTITAEAKTKVFGTDDPALTYTVEGLVEGESLTGALARAEGEAVGEYDITQGTLAASANYSVTFTGAKFTITANPNKPNNNVVNTDKPTTQDGEDFYEPNADTQQLLKQSSNVSLGFSAGASQNVNVGENGVMTFTQGQDADIMVNNQKTGDVLKMEFQGTIKTSSDHLQAVGSQTRTRGTRGGQDLELVSGAEYRVVHDGNIVLTVVLTEAPATITGINVSSSGSTGISSVEGVQPAESVYYDLNGHKFYSKPTKKGVYIHQGTKVVVK